MQNKFLRDEEYSPSEDTFFIADYIEKEKGVSALDIGSGSGYLTKLLGKTFTFVVGTDINFVVLKNQTYRTENLICCNGADAITMEFDLVVCNLPYLATDEILDAVTDGGKEGVEIPIKIFDSIYKNIKIGGKFLFVTSSLSNYQKLMDYTQKLGLTPRILAKKKLFFEELILVEAIREK
ncbi:MAG: methyltransferase domain-containing protein [Nitrosarchaeum sp.]|nr:methyltransferase domain-containing protein [Nitrosarchaeum sp.]MBP0119785.1 methyltransferase domain-containing protein [Nitrosarchaeum sp.]MBP0134218.1 methyltransferase domain-containing protein [Nitrosarchaeum sp.]MSV26512.1 methyltransferase domain-containing protein [Nitrosarchaeum sp.]PHY08648.1 MAG: methylase [Nitrosarchaeum sp.]